MNQWKPCLAAFCCLVLLGACGDSDEVIAAKRVAAAARKADEELADRQAKALAAMKKDENEARESVRKILKDPDSAKFGKFTQIDDGHACLEVNSKNSYGGYSGFSMIMLVRIGTSPWHAIDYLNEQQQNGLCAASIRSKK